MQGHTNNAYASRILPVKIKRRQRTLHEWEAAMCITHLHNGHARAGGKHRTAFWKELAQLCAGGVRICGMDANMGLWGDHPRHGTARSGDASVRSPRGGFAESP